MQNPSHLQGILQGTMSLLTLIIKQQPLLKRKVVFAQSGSLLGGSIHCFDFITSKIVWARIEFRIG